jgi:hypothetical protein
LKWPGKIPEIKLKKYTNIVKKNPPRKKVKLFEIGEIDTGKKQEYNSQNKSSFFSSEDPSLIDKRLLEITPL